MSSPDGAVLGLVGLCSWWRDHTKDHEDPDRWILTATLLTSDAVHTREGSTMILPEELRSHWLDPSVIGDQALFDEAVRAGVALAEVLRVDRVAPFGTQDDGPQLIRPVTASPAARWVNVTRGAQRVLW